MSFVFPDALAPEVYPLAWLVGRWEGEGVVEYPGVPRTVIRNTVVFDHDGGPYLTYTSTISVIADDGEEGPVWSVESGFWRVSPVPPEGIELEEGQHAVELVLADASGSIALYVGTVGGGRIDLGSDLMARTASAPDVAGGTRMYGNVHGELLWAWDLAAFGHELRSYASAQLRRVAAGE